MKIHARLVALALAAALAGAGPALAHEGHVHKVMGVVSAFHADANTLEVKATTGATETVSLNEATKYLKGAAAATTGDIVAGIRVVVSYKEEGGKKIATEVRIGTAAPATAKTVPAPSASPKSRSQ